jgi:hypothetical protein
MVPRGTYKLAWCRTYGELFLEQSYREDLWIEALRFLSALFSASVVRLCCWHLGGLLDWQLAGGCMA